MQKAVVVFAQQKGQPKLARREKVKVKTKSSRGCRTPLGTGRTRSVTTRTGRKSTTTQIVVRRRHAATNNAFKGRGRRVSKKGYNQFLEGLLGFSIESANS